MRVRPIVAFVALFAIPLPACLHVQKVPKSPTPPDEGKIAARAADGSPTPPRILFAELPSRPGAVVFTNPQPKLGPSATAQKSPNPEPKTAQPVQPIATEPGPFPIVHVASPLPEAPLVAAMREYAAGRPERAIELLRPLDKSNQDAILALLPILNRLATADLANDPVTVAMLVDQLHSVTARLESRAALRIDKVAFCKDVLGFGRFVPWPDNHPYRPNEQARLYLEVRNLVSQPTNDGFVTHVHAAVEIRNANEQLVEQIDHWRRRVPVVKFDKQLPSRTPLHDFHVLYIFPVPATPGVYTITVELRDSTGHRTVKSKPTQFCVAGP